MNSLAVAGFALAVRCFVVASVAAPSPALPRPVPADSSVLILADSLEVGARLVVTGHVFAADGKRLLAGIRIGVYHTDAKGEYGVKPGAGSFPPRRDARLSGWLVTDSAGRYEVRTIRPGAYPGGGTPEHIHFIVDGHLFELRFADDPRVTTQERERSRAAGTFGGVRPVLRDARGVLRVVEDFRTLR